MKYIIVISVLVCPFNLFSTEFSLMKEYYSISTNYIKNNKLESDPFFYLYELSEANEKYFFQFPSHEKKREIVFSSKDSYLKIDATYNTASENGQVIELSILKNQFNESYVVYIIYSFNNVYLRRYSKLYVFKIKNSSIVDVTASVLPKITISDYYIDKQEHTADIKKFSDYSNNRFNIFYTLSPNNSKLKAQLYIEFDVTYQMRNETNLKERDEFVEKLKDRLDYNTLYLRWDKSKSKLIIKSKAKENFSESYQIRPRIGIDEDW